MKKFALYLCAVFLSVSALDVLCSIAIDSLTCRRYVAGIAHVTGATEQMVIIGSSRASHHYDTTILADSLGLSVHNYGLEGQNVYSDAVMVAMLLRHAMQKPLIAVIDLSEPDISDVPGWNTDHLDLFFPYVGEPAVDSLLSDVLHPCELFFVRHSALYRHNSRLIDYAMGTAGDRSDGFSPLHGQWTALPATVDCDSPYLVSRRKTEYLENTIRLCTDNGVHPVLAISPNYKRLPAQQRWVSEARRIASKHGIPFLNMEQDEEFLVHPEWFHEPYHLNATGAAAYTRKFALLLRKQYPSQ